MRYPKVDLRGYLWHKEAEWSEAWGKMIADEVISLHGMHV
jgi:hypothetical protein